MAEYCTVEELKQWLADDVDNVGAMHDSDLLRVLVSASRQVERDCGRLFYLSSAEARTTYVNRLGEVCLTDLVAGTITSVQYDANDDDTVETALTSTYYRLLPKLDENGAPAVRYQTMVAKQNSAHSAFTPGTLFEVTADYGYLEDSLAPESIKAAVLLLAARTFQRRSAVFGREMIPEVGLAETLPKADPDYRRLIAPYVHPKLDWWLT